MKLSIILLIVGLCVVSAKYLPEEWENSGQLLSRFKRFDLGDSDTSSEDDDESDSKNDDSDNSRDETYVKEQSKHIANLEKMRQKLLEKQEKERLKQEEAQRKIEEKIAKELQKEEEKRQKEQRKWEEKLEKERKKLEDEQRKIQEKIQENERKRQENLQKEMEEVESNSNTSKDDDSDDDSIELEDIWKTHIYSKYGITEENTNVEKKAALRKYMQEQLGLNANSTQSERRQAVLRFIQSELQKVPNINILRSQFIDYINYVGVQKIQTKLEGDIEKLKNKTETLNNVNLTWVPIAKQNLAEQVSFLETIKQFLSNLLPNWFDANTDNQQQGVSVTNADSIISLDSGTLTQQTNDANPTDAISTNSNVSPSNTEGNVPNSSPVSDGNGALMTTSSSVVSESSLVDSENPTNQLGTVSENNSQTPSASETNGATITGNEDTVDKQLPSETSAVIVEVTKNSINELNTNGVTKPDTDITKESAQSVSATNSDVSGSSLNEKPSTATDSVITVNNGAIAPITPSEGNPSELGASVGDSTNQNIDGNTNENVDAVIKNADSTTTYSKNEVTNTAEAVTTEDAISSSLIPSSDLGEASSSTSNNNNENTSPASSIANEPMSTSDSDSKNSITDTVLESSPAVDNGVVSSGLSGSDITEATLTSIASDYSEPSVNILDVSSTTSEGSNNVNSDGMQNKPTNTSNNEASENSLTANGNQSQVITEAIEVITPATIANESSNVVNQEQSNLGSSNTERLINEMTTAVTEQILTAETRLQDVSLANDLKTDSVTQETPINTPVPVEPGAAVVDIAQQ
ncbi:myb-like protein X [Papilio machaon]|uniref:myb-like protein X n=1 Tax=Papilio machaon TaxID=76193 RepID=UPI001E66345D|nr:myb-like protein X [Papilio machaon]